MKERIDKKRTWMSLIFLLFLAVNSVYAQVFNPTAVLQSMENKFQALGEIYKAQGYTTDEKGNQIPLLNPQYEGLRLGIDFVLLFGLFALLFRKNETVKNMLGKQGGVILAFVLSVSYLVGAKMFIGRFAILLPQIVTVSIAIFIYYGILYALGGPDKVGGWIKLLVLLLAFAAAYFAYMSMFDQSFSIAGIPKISMLNQQTQKIDYFGTGNDLPQARIKAGAGLGAIGSGTSSQTGNYETLYNEAKTLYDSANKNFNDKKYSDAKTNIDDAKSKNSAAKTEADKITDANSKKDWTDKIEAQRKQIGDLAAKINAKATTSTTTRPATSTTATRPATATGPTADEASIKLNGIIMGNIVNPAKGKSDALAYIESIKKYVGQKDLTQQTIDSLTSIANQLK